MGLELVYISVSFPLVIVQPDVKQLNSGVMVDLPWFPWFYSVKHLETWETSSIEQIGTSVSVFQTRAAAGGAEGGGGGVTEREGGD